MAIGVGFWKPWFTTTWRKALIFPPACYSDGLTNAVRGRVDPYDWYEGQDPTGKSPHCGRPVCWVGYPGTSRVWRLERMSGLTSARADGADKDGTQ
jgi:hypothetical protein